MHLHNCVCSFCFYWYGDCVMCEGAPFSNYSDKSRHSGMGAGGLGVVSSIPHNKPESKTFSNRQCENVHLISDESYY